MCCGSALFRTPMVRHDVDGVSRYNPSLVGETGPAADPAGHPLLFLLASPGTPPGEKKKMTTFALLLRANPAMTVPPRNVQLRQEYSTRIGEVKITRGDGSFFWCVAQQWG